MICRINKTWLTWVLALLAALTGPPSVWSTNSLQLNSFRGIALPFFERVPPISSRIGKKGLDNICLLMFAPFGEEHAKCLVLLVAFINKKYIAKLIH